MLISHRKNFIFTKTVKAAGTSVESYFEKWCMPEGTWSRSRSGDEYISDTGIIGERSKHPDSATRYNHMSSYNICEQLGPEMWDDYFKFTVVRNPFDKMVSGFFWFHRNQTLDGNEVSYFRIWLQSFNELAKMNKSLIEAYDVPHYSKPMQLSLIDRDKYLIDGEECVDYIIRFESLYQGMKNVCNKLDIPFKGERVPELKKGIRHHRIPLGEYFDIQSQEIVHQLFDWQIPIVDSLYKILILVCDLYRDRVVGCRYCG